MTETTDYKWEVTIFQSGTTIAKKGNMSPHFYIVGCPGYTGTEMMNMRRNVAHEICRFMNDEEPEGGIINVDHFDEYGRMVLDSGIVLSSTGPYYNRNPPALDWNWNDSPAAKEQRAALTRDLFNRIQAAS